LTTISTTPGYVGALVTGHIRPREPEPIRNIAQLFDALAVGWVEGGPNRTLIASRHYGSFVRPPPHHSTHPAYRQAPGDIPVESGNYHMAGLIKFEANYLFPGLLKTESAEDDFFHMAWLTAAGYEAAKAGLLSFDVSHPDIARSAFLNPRGPLVNGLPAIGAAAQSQEGGK